MTRNNYHVRPDAQKRTVRPPNHDLHNWLAAASGYAPSEDAAIEAAHRDLMTFVLSQNCDVDGKAWIATSARIVENGKVSYAVIVKCRVKQRFFGTPVRISVTPEEIGIT